MTDWQVMLAAMRADPENAGLIMVAADAWEEAGKPLEAEALRWLGENGLVGEPEHRPPFSKGYNSWKELAWIAAGETVSRRQFVAHAWWMAAYIHLWVSELNRENVTGWRLMLCEAYAKATAEVRAAWLKTTAAGLTLFDERDKGQT